MKYLRVRNWERWQTFRNDRGPPPWIKLYRDLLHDVEFIALTASQRGELVSIWLLAGAKNGRVPYDASWIKQQAGLRRVPDLDWFIERGFFVLESIIETPIDVPLEHGSSTNGARFEHGSSTEETRYLIENQELTANPDATMTSSGCQLDRTEGRGREREIDKRKSAPVDKSPIPSPPQDDGKPNGRLDRRGFEAIKGIVRDLVERFDTSDPDKLMNLGGRSKRISEKQMRAAIRQLREDREI